MIYKRYFEDIDTKGQREFFDFITGQVTRRTMSADDQGLFVEYENREHEPTKCAACKVISPSDSGHFTSFALPMAVAAIAMYLMHFMASHGIFAAFSVLGGR